MIVLGIIDSKPSSAALLRDGEILAAISEERLCRMKLASGMPRQAITEVMRVAEVVPSDIDRIAVAQKVSVFEPQPIPWSGWFTNQDELKTYHFDRLSAGLAPIVGRFPLSWRIHHQLKRFVSRERIQRIPQLLREAYGFTAPVTFYDHHYCHATCAYYTANFRDALVVTLDGGGDGLSGSVYTGRGGQLTKLAGVDSFTSLGNFYSYITELCGFSAEKHEGKVTGLAALGRPIHAEQLRQFIRYKDPGQIVYTIPMYHNSALDQLRRRLPEGFDRADMAASVQLLLEEIGTAFIRYWLRRTGLRDIAVAGGVFANVKFNQRVHELDEVDRFFVHPAMDDSGLSVGSALAELLAGSSQPPTHLMRRLPNVYFGAAYEPSEISRAIDRFGFEASYLPNIHKEIAKLLAEGHVVARFHGAMEYGPRALGNRSILYQTTDASVNDWLNHRLVRTEFMPFAPATLAEYASHCYENLEGAEDTARFMTITLNCTPEMRRVSPGVVHVDGTARPQLIDASTAPDFYAILQAYHQLTGIPSLINTSFNMHEEPIVCTPDDALRSFKAGKLDYLALENWLVPHPDLATLQRTARGEEQYT